MNAEFHAVFLFGFNSHQTEKSLHVMEVQEKEQGRDKKHERKLIRKQLKKASAY